MTMAIAQDDKAIHITLFGVGNPKHDNEHSWLDLDGFRHRGEFVCFGAATKLHYGDVVATSMQQGTTDELRYVGYVVQIREKAGCHGSDLVLVRHPDGVLVSHENQSFYLLRYKDAHAVLAHSNDRPADEGGAEPYTLQGKHPASGFVVPAKIEGYPK